MIASQDDVRNVPQINIALLENTAHATNVFIRLQITMENVQQINIALLNNTAQDLHVPNPMIVILIVIVQDSIKSANLEIVYLNGQLVEAIQTVEAVELEAILQSNLNLSVLTISDLLE